MKKRLLDGGDQSLRMKVGRNLFPVDVEGSSNLNTSLKSVVAELSVPLDFAIFAQCNWEIPVI